MIQGFADLSTEDIWNGENTKRARRCCPKDIWGITRRKLDLLHAATILSDLAIPPGNNLEKLQKDRKGQHSIKLNDQYRICFTWTEAGPIEVEITDYH